MMRAAPLPDRRPPLSMQVETSTHLSLGGPHGDREPAAGRQVELVQLVVQLAVHGILLAEAVGDPAKEEGRLLPVAHAKAGPWGRGCQASTLDLGPLHTSVGSQLSMHEGFHLMMSQELRQLSRSTDNPTAVVSGVSVMGYVDGQLSRSLCSPGNSSSKPATGGKCHVGRLRLKGAAASRRSRGRPVRTPGRGATRHHGPFRAQPCPHPSRLCARQTQTGHHHARRSGIHLHSQIGMGFSASMACCDTES